MMRAKSKRRVTAAAMATVVLTGVLFWAAPSAFAGSFVVNTNDDLAGICDPAHCSLREAIGDANARPGFDTIGFALKDGSRTIAPTTPLPAITDAVAIDGTTQPGYSGVPLVTLNGEVASSLSRTPVNGLEITGGGSRISGLVINGFDGAGVWISGVGGNSLEGNYIGTDGTATSAVPNSGGVVIHNSPGNTIGGLDPAARNVVSGNSGYTGLDGVGIAVQGGKSVANRIAGNYIGTDASGTSALGNSGTGVALTIGVAASSMPVGTLVGGTQPGARNVISSNTTGITVCCYDEAENTIQGNFIGTDATGERALGNRFSGISLGSGGRTTIGGSTPGAGNVISGNGSSGIETVPNAGPTTIQGNYIGTDKDGEARIGNAGSGVFSRNPGNVVGGATSGARNIISGNKEYGINLCCASGNDNRVLGNFIGTDVSGTKDLGNGRSGIVLFSSNNVIGGAESGEGNLISGNDRSGLALDGSTGNQVKGNLIGTDVTGRTPLANAHDGVRIVQSASGNRIGGPNPGDGNVIAFNSLNGVTVFALYVPAGTANEIRGNSIFANGALGIDLSARALDGVTANDPGDQEEGGNRLENWPVLEGGGGRSPVVHGTLESTPGTSLLIEFFSTSECDASGFGEGEVSSGTITVTTDQAGIAKFRANLRSSTLLGHVTATATDSQGNTSEFSNCR